MEEILFTSEIKEYQEPLELGQNEIALGKLKYHSRNPITIDEKTQENYELFQINAE